MVWALPMVGKAVLGAAAGAAVNKLMPGQKGTPATVQNASPTEDMTLRASTGNILNNLVTNPGSIPSYNGPLTAGMAPGENVWLNELNRFVGGNTGTRGAMDTLTRLQTNPFASMAGGDSAFSPIVTGGSGTGKAGLALARDILTGSTMNPETDSMVQAAIRSAQRPLVDRFEDDLAATRSAATRAGQFVQPGASSPFELAKAKLNTGLAAAMGDIGADIAFANLANERQRQMNILGLQAGSVEAGLNRQQQSQESGLNRQLTAANSVTPMNRGVIDGIMETLRGNALPRLIEQEGIDAGVSNFKDQRDTFLNLLSQAFAGSAGNPVVVPGAEGTPSFLQSLAPGIAAGVGTSVGTTAGDALSRWLSETFSRPQATV
jgi:hypothetical protein